MNRYLLMWYNNVFDLLCVFLLNRNPQSANASIADTVYSTSRDLILFTWINLKIYPNARVMICILWMTPILMLVWMLITYTVIMLVPVVLVTGPQVFLLIALPVTAFVTW